MPNTLTRRQVVGGLAAAGLVGCKPRSASRDTGAPTPTPTADGFWAPAETEPHAGCIMQLPPPEHYCTGGATDCSLIERVRAEWAAVALAIAEHEPVVMYACAADLAGIQQLVGGAVTVVEAALNDGWSRDTGPVLLRNAQGGVRAACFQFNGWGGSYSYADDAVVKWRMAADLGVKTYDQSMVLEGGAVIVDGAGTLVTTEACLLDASRNPDLDQAVQEQILKDWFGVSRVIWLENGWVPDPLTNGHIDGIAAFVAPGLMLLNSVPRAADPTNYAILESARERLEAAGVELIRLSATSMTAFHINFYVANGAVIVPIEGKSSVDDTPLGVLRDAFPGHQVVGVEANTIGQSGGGVHCITQQVPAGLVWPY